MDPMVIFPILTSVMVILIGSFFFLKPTVAIEMQRMFYEKINWRIDPISMPKEIRNTKLIGVFLIVVAIVAAVYTLSKGW